MNKIFTLFAMGMVCLFVNTANAQTVTESFDSGLPTGTCWSTSSFSPETIKINGTNNNVISTQGSSLSILTTPFIEIPSNGVVNFKYYSTALKQSGSSISFTVYLENISGSKTPIGSDQNIFGKEWLTFSTQVNNGGTYKILIEFTNLGSLGNTYALMNDLSVSGTLSTRSCTVAAPTAEDDNFGALSLTSTVSGNVTTNDINSNNKTLIAAVSKYPATGTLNFNSDGTFTYKPEEGFTGGTVTFTYTITDESYAPLTSNIATVYIEYSSAIVLPVKFVTFSGNAHNAKAELVWSVAANETGNHFEVEGGTDGKNFRSIATVLASSTVGSESYTYPDAAFSAAGSFYRIKAVNKDQSTSYSRIIFIKGNVAANNKITLMQNPVQSSLNFAFTAATDEANEVAIYNLAGVKMYSQKIQARKGTNSFSLNLDGKLARGSYVLTVNSAATQRSIQLIKQ